MSDYTDLEIGLYAGEVDGYIVELHYNDPSDPASYAAERGTMRINLEALRGALLDPVGYGKLLTDALFADTVLRSYYEKALGFAEQSDKALRLRLHIDRGAPELNDLRWETLRDPRDGSWLLTRDRTLFSRFLYSTNWERVLLRSRGELRALVVIANPADLADGAYRIGDQKLAPVDVAGELGRAATGLGDIAHESLTSDQARPGQASLKNLAQTLRQGFDILYLVCHGALLAKEPAGPYLWLEREDGTADVVPGSALVERIKDLSPQLRPRLVVLASCQSAGTGEEAKSSDTQGALAALGPQLARVGIPAVVAMQGDVTMQTVAEFIPVFFEELQRDGQVDRAIAVARGAVRDRQDSWLPVLYLRLRGGRIWYTPGFGGERGDFEKWPAILRAIKRSQCTPILGPGLYEKLLGSPRDIALRWAEQYHYPLEPHGRESLPQVAQFLTINQYQAAPFDALEDTLIQEIRQRLGDGAQLTGHENLDQLMEIAGSTLRRSDPLEPYRVLAELPLPIYITTNLNNLLASALKETNKDPQVVLCPWNEDVKMIESIYDTEPDYLPTIDRPLVYHLFGRLSQPESVVLTEDHYFDFLIGVTRNSDLIPPDVRRALADTALLFLGFHIDDWQFRVLFRSIISQQGSSRRGRYPHIAVQIEPEEDRLLEPERARRFLESYYFQGANISLYWGNVEDFVGELLPRWQAAPA
jgi:hypothetical protein